MNLISELESPSLHEVFNFEGHPIATALTLPWTWVPAHSTTLAGCTKACHRSPPRNHTPGRSPSMEGASNRMDQCEVQHRRGEQDK